MIPLPRTKGKIKKAFGKKEYFAYLMNNFTKEDIQGLKGHSVKVLSNALDEYNRRFMERLCDTGNTYDLPHGFGMMYICRQPPRIYKTLYGEKNKFMVDWPVTNDYRDKYPERINSSTGGKIYHLNKHTGTHILKFNWDKTTLRHNIVRFFRFQPVRYSQRYLAKVAKDPLRKVDYFRKDYSFRSDSRGSYKAWRRNVSASQQPKVS